MANKVKVGRKRLIAAAGIMVPGVLAASAVAANPAAALTNPLRVSSMVCGTGSSVVWNSDPNLVLTAGTATPGTCGAPANSTSNPAYARVYLKDAASVAAPTTEPVFKASAYSAGTPRLVITLYNGKTLVGYPGRALSGQSGPDAAGMAWAVGSSSTYTDYQKAYAAAGASSTTVDEAYIVEDASQPAGTANTLTGIEYDGKVVGAGVVLVQPAAPQTVTIGVTPPVSHISAQTTSSDTKVTISVTGLPDGLSFNPKTGDVTGTPAADAKSGAVTVTARDAYGQTGTGTIVYTVNPKPAPVPVLSHGQAYATAPTRETVTWQQTVPSWEMFTIVGPGAINGHVGWVLPGTEAGYYSGLEAHHGYTVTYTPYTSKYGSPIAGAVPGKVYFVS